jgi:hypothetical protein
MKNDVLADLFRNDTGEYLRQLVHVINMHNHSLAYVCISRQSVFEYVLKKD